MLDVRGRRLFSWKKGAYGGMYKKNLTDYTPDEIRDAIGRDLDEDMARLDREFEESQRKIPTMQDIMEASDLPKPSEYERERRARRTHHTNEERLAYYRTHGLVSCDDYPGGDAQFEADVLSGAYHDEDGDMDEPPREDAYIIGKMLDGTFLFEKAFKKYGYNIKVRAAYNAVFYKLGAASFYART